MLNFVSQPRRMVAEMVRVARSVAAVAAYVWDYSSLLLAVACPLPPLWILTPGTLTETVGRANPAACGGLLFEAVHQLTQVVTSIAKSSPEHYADISFSLGDFALRILARSSRAAFSSFSKRSHHISRGISSSLGSFGIQVQGCTCGSGEKYLIPPPESVHLSIPCF